jgi:hypothetical protein
LRLPLPLVPASRIRTPLRTLNLFYFFNAIFYFCYSFSSIEISKHTYWQLGALLRRVWALRSIFRRFSLGIVPTLTALVCVNTTPRSEPYPSCKGLQNNSWPFSQLKI